MYYSKKLVLTLLDYYQDQMTRMQFLKIIRLKATTTIVSLKEIVKIYQDEI